MISPENKSFTKNDKIKTFDMHFKNIKYLPIFLIKIQSDSINLIIFTLPKTYEWTNTGNRKNENYVETIIFLFIPNGHEPAYAGKPHQGSY